MVSEVFVLECLVLFVRLWFPFLLPSSINTFLMCMVQGRIMGQYFLRLKQILETVLGTTIRYLYMCMNKHMQSVSDTPIRLSIRQISPVILNTKLNILSSLCLKLVTLFTKEVFA